MRTRPLKAFAGQENKQATTLSGGKLQRAGTPKSSPFRGDLDSLQTRGFYASMPQSGISIGSTVFAQLTGESNTLTGTQTTD